VGARTSSREESGESLRGRVSAERNGRNLWRLESSRDGLCLVFAVACEVSRLPELGEPYIVLKCAALGNGSLNVSELVEAPKVGHVGADKVPEIPDLDFEIDFADFADSIFHNRLLFVLGCLPVLIPAQNC